MIRWRTRGAIAVLVAVATGAASHGAAADAEPALEQVVICFYAVAVCGVKQPDPPPPYEIFSRRGQTSVSEFAAQQVVAWAWDLAFGYSTRHAQQLKWQQQDEEATRKRWEDTVAKGKLYTAQAAAKPELLVKYPVQGVLDFRADAPVFAGQREHHARFCNWGLNFPFNDALPGEHKQGIDSMALYHRADGGVDVTVNNTDWELRFENLHAGVETQAARVEFNIGGRRHRTPPPKSPQVSITYTPTLDNRCLTMNLPEQPSRVILEKLAQTSGIQIDGLDRVPNDARFYVYRAWGDTTVLMRHIAHAARLSLIERDDTHYELR